MSLGRELYRGIIEWNPDIVHSQCEFSTFFMAKRSQRNVKILWCILTILYTKIIPTIFPLTRNGGRDMVQFLTRQISEKVDSMIAPAQK